MRPLYMLAICVYTAHCEALNSWFDQVLLHNRRTDPRALLKVRNTLLSGISLLTISRCGEIKRLIMGLDRYQKTPCGFCFVEYYTHQDALDCMKYIGGTKLDERVIRTDLDAGFQDGRQFGRGKSGGQVRDEYRDEFDPGRGGYGRAIDAERKKEEEEYGSGR